MCVCVCRAGLAKYYDNRRHKLCQDPRTQTRIRTRTHSVQVYSKHSWSGWLLCCACALGKLSSCHVCVTATKLEARCCLPSGWRPQCVCVICKWLALALASEKKRCILLRAMDDSAHAFAFLCVYFYFCFLFFSYFDTNTKPLKLSSPRLASGAIYQIFYTNFCCLSTLILALSWLGQKGKGKGKRKSKMGSGGGRRARACRVKQANKTHLLPQPTRHIK